MLPKLETEPIWYLVYQSSQLLATIQQVIETKHGSFTPLVFGSHGSMEKERMIFHKRLAEMITDKSDNKNHEIMTNIRKEVIFTLLDHRCYI